jgi:hypothetical protein
MSEEERKRFFKPSNRIRIINTWRPLIKEVEDRPLAVCNYRSVNSKDLIAIDRVFPHQLQQNYLLHHNDQQRFYYLSKQTPSDLVIMVQYDTRASGNARYCPHVSFPNPNAPTNATIRRSIETRSIVITENEE